MSVSGKSFCDNLAQLPPVRMMGERARTEYFAKVQEGAQVMDENLCWVCEWFREPLPLEGRSGVSMEIAWNNSVSLGGYSETPGEYPKENYATAAGLRVLVFPDSYGYCDGILRAAENWGRIEQSHVVKKSPAAISPEDIKGELEPGWDIIIFASGIDTPKDNGTTAVLQHQNAVTKLYLILLQGIIKNARATKKLVCLTCDIFADEAEIHEEVGVGLITCANLFGLSNSARLELDFPLQFIDTEWALQDESVPLLASEVFRESSFGKNAVRILNSGRYVMRQMPSRPYEVANTQFELPPAGVIAISGGNGALAMVMGKWFLQKAHKQNAANAAKKLPPLQFELKFLSRSAKISDQTMEGWKVVEGLAQQVGIKVEQCKCDVSSQEQVDKFIEECSPNLSGFVHAAGVLQDAMLFTQTWEKYEKVFDPKSRAALYIHKALERSENPGLRFLWLFSSTSVFGNAGATNYSSSNAYLDALSRHRRALGKPSCTIQWSSWAEAGMAASMTGPARERLFASPQPPFSNSEGCKGMEAGLRTGLPYFSVNKWNAQAVLGMTFQGDVPTQEYNRNFTANFAPLPPECLGGNKDIYSMYCSSMGLGENLIYSGSVEPVHSDDLMARALAVKPLPLPTGGGALQEPPRAKVVEDNPDSGDDTADESEEATGKTLQERIAERCQVEREKSPVQWTPISNEVVTSNHTKRAAGSMYGIEFPWTAEMLLDFGPRWLTRAFHKAGSLPKNNKVTKVTLERNIVVDGGNNASKFLFEVQYMRKADYLHTRLFAKIPFPLDGPTFSDRLSSSVNKQPMDLYEINTYRVLESSLPVKTPRFYFGDISNMTTNFILITERVPFAEMAGQREGVLQPFEVEGPYEKCKDWLLRGPAKEYYLKTFDLQARIAGFHKAGKLGDDGFLWQHGLVSWFPDAAQPEAWGANQQASTGEPPAIAVKKLETCLRFVSEIAKVVFPAYVVERQFATKFVNTMLKHQAYTAEIEYYKHYNPDYVALGHMNLNLDNAYFWRDESGQLDCGMFDFGGFKATSLPHKIYWALNCAEFEDTKANLEEYIDAFIEMYQGYGGPKLDHGRFRTALILTALSNLYFMVSSVPNCLKQCPEKEWATIADRHDPRISSNVGGKSTLRTTIQAMCNGIRIIEELKADEVVEDWVQSFWVGELQRQPKSSEAITG